MIVREIKGDLLDTDLNFIAHGVNCRNKMGSGVAKAILTKYPEVKEGYHALHRSGLALCTNGSDDFLGTAQPIDVHDGKVVFNLFTQLDYGYDGKQYVSYKAIEECFKSLTLNCDYINAIAIPRIGCGLAGGDWDKVKEIINSATKNKLDVYVYYLE